MSCPCICDCLIYDLGLFACNECIELPFVAGQSGKFQLKAEWRNKTWYIPATLVDGEILKFQNIFNEDSTVYFQIINPDLTVFEHKVYDVNDVLIATYCNFSLTVKEIFTYIEEEITAQEICGSELSEEEAKVIVCKTF